MAMYFADEGIPLKKERTCKIKKIKHLWAR